MLQQCPVLSAGNLMKPLPTCSGTAGTLKILEFWKDIYQWRTQNTTLSASYLTCHLCMCTGFHKRD